MASKSERLGKSLAEKVGEAAKEAAERIADDDEEWSVADGTDDGGVPVYNLAKVKEPAPSRGRGGNRGNRGRGDRGRGGQFGGTRGSQSGTHVDSIAAESIPVGPPPPYSRQGCSNAYVGQDTFGGSYRQQGTLDDGRGGYGEWDEENVGTGYGGGARRNLGLEALPQQSGADDGSGVYGDWEEGHVSAGSGGGVDISRGGHVYSEGSPRQRGRTNRGNRGQRGAQSPEEARPGPRDPPWGPRGHDTTWW